MQFKMTPDSGSEVVKGENVIQLATREPDTLKLQSLFPAYHLGRWTETPIGQLNYIVQEQPGSGVRVGQIGSSDREVD